MNGQTVKCPICRRPYKVYMHTVADQSACPGCVREAEQQIRKASDSGWQR